MSDREAYPIIYTIDNIIYIVTLFVRFVSVILLGDDENWVMIKLLRVNPSRAVITHRNYLAVKFVGLLDPLNFDDRDHRK